MNNDHKYQYQAYIYDVYDGDTFKAEVDLGFHCSVRETFRLYGVDTPEKRGESYDEGIRVRDLVRDLILDKTLTITTYKNGGSGSLGNGQGKYGRWLAKVTLEDGSDLGSMLIASGDAESYFD